MASYYEVNYDDGDIYKGRHRQTNLLFVCRPCAVAGGRARVRTSARARRGTGSAGAWCGYTVPPECSTAWGGGHEPERSVTEQHSGTTLGGKAPGPGAPARRRWDGAWPAGRARRRPWHRGGNRAPGTTQRSRPWAFRHMGKGKRVCTDLPHVIRESLGAQWAFLTTTRGAVPCVCGTGARAAGPQPVARGCRVCAGGRRGPTALGALSPWGRGNNLL